MDTLERLTVLKEQQHQVLEQYEDLLKSFDSAHLIQQKEELEHELTRCKADLTELESRYKMAEAENQDLRISLREQIIDEKLNILKISRQN